MHFLSFLGNPKAEHAGNQHSLRSSESKHSLRHDGGSCFGIFKGESEGLSNNSSSWDAVGVSSDSEGPGKFKTDLLGEVGDTGGISMAVSFTTVGLLTNDGDLTPITLNPTEQEIGPLEDLLSLLTELLLVIFHFSPISKAQGGGSSKCAYL